MKTVLLELATAAKQTQAEVVQSEAELQKVRADRDIAEEKRKYADQELRAARERIEAANAARLVAEGDLATDAQTAAEAERQRTEAVTRAAAARAALEETRKLLGPAEAELAKAQSEQQATEQQLQQATGALMTTRDTAQRQLEALKQAVDEEKRIAASLQGETGQWAAEQQVCGPSLASFRCCCWRSVWEGYWLLVDNARFVGADYGLCLQRLAEDNAKVGVSVKELRAAVAEALKQQQELKTESEQLAAAQSDAQAAALLAETRRKQQAEIAKLQAAMAEEQKQLDALRTQHAELRQQVATEHAAVETV